MKSLDVKTSAILDALQLGEPLPGQQQLQQAGFLAPASAVGGLVADPASAGTQHAALLHSGQKRAHPARGSSPNGALQLDVAAGAAAAAAAAAGVHAQRASFTPALPSVEEDASEALPDAAALQGEAGGEPAGGGAAGRGGRGGRTVHHARRRRSSGSGSGSDGGPLKAAPASHGGFDDDDDGGGGGGSDGEHQEEDSDYDDDMGRARKDRRVGAGGFGGKSANELMLLDPKRMKRILANRQSAARSKERRMKHTNELEAKLQALGHTLERLERELQGNTASGAELARGKLEADQQVAALQTRLAAISSDNQALMAELFGLQTAVGLPRALPAAPMRAQQAPLAMPGVPLTQGGVAAPAGAPAAGLAGVNLAGAAAAACPMSAPMLLAPAAPTAASAGAQLAAAAAMLPLVPPPPPPAAAAAAGYDLDAPPAPEDLAMIAELLGVSADDSAGSQPRGAGTLAPPPLPASFVGSPMRVDGGGLAAAVAADHSTAAQPPPPTGVWPGRPLAPGGGAAAAPGSSPPPRISDSSLLSCQSPLLSPVAFGAGAPGMSTWLAAPGSAAATGAAHALLPTSGPLGALGGAGALPGAGGLTTRLQARRHQRSASTGSMPLAMDWQVGSLGAGGSNLVNASRASSGGRQPARPSPFMQPAAPQLAPAAVQPQSLQQLPALMQPALQQPAALASQQLQQQAQAQAQQQLMQQQHAQQQRQLQRQHAQEQQQLQQQQAQAHQQFSHMGAVVTTAVSTTPSMDVAQPMAGDALLAGHRWGLPGSFPQGAAPQPAAATAAAAVLGLAPGQVPRAPSDDFSDRVRNLALHM